MEMQVTNTFNKTSLAYYNQEYRQIVSYGGSRSSKSFSILQLLLLEMMRRKNIKITVWRNLKNVCRQTVLEDFRNIILFDNSVYNNIKENKQSGTFTYIPTGSRIVFDGSDNIGKVLGSAQHISFFNEVTEFGEEVYLQITQRTSDRIFCDYNPSKMFWLENQRGNDDTTFIHSTFLDNAFCPDAIVKQLKSYEPWETDSYEVVNGVPTYNGKPINTKNQPPPHKENVKNKTAREFMWLVYGLGVQAEKPTRIYKGWYIVSQKKFDELPYQSYFGVDFGSASPTAVTEVKYNGDGMFYICLRMYKPLGDIGDSIVGAIKRHVPQITLGKSILVCDSAKQSYIDTLKMAGHMAIKAIKGSGSIVSGIADVQSANISYVHNREFEKEYHTYSWNTDRYDQPTDDPIKLDDHAMDSLRYIISYLIKYLNIKQ